MPEINQDPRADGGGADAAGADVQASVPSNVLSPVDPAAAGAGLVVPAAAEQPGMDALQ